MLALIGNLSVGETVLIAIVAILVFGERLPQAMSRAYREFLRFRGQIDKLRRESGIDQEVRNIKRTFHETASQARLDSPVDPPVPRTPDYDVQKPREETDPAAEPSKPFPDYLLDDQERAVREAAEAADWRDRSSDDDAEEGPADSQPEPDDAERKPPGNE